MAKREANILVTLRDRASSGLRRLSGVAGTLTKAFGLVAAAATAVTTVIGARFLSGAIRSAGEFDEAMSTVGAVTQATSEELDLLRQAADEAGASTRFTATEAANGLEELARSGQNASEAVATLNPVLQLAAGNNQTVAESAIQVTTALNAFGLAAEEAGRVSDVFTRAAQRSAQTTGQLGEAMTFVAPVARQAGIDIEQTAALIGRLADAGFRGSLGGTALRNAILQFQDPASNFRKELERLGIRTDNFVEALEQLSGAGDGAEAAIRSLGLRAGPAIQAIVAGGAPALRELTEELRNAQGASEEAAAALEDNLPGALRGFASAFDAARRRLVEPLVERITTEIQNLTVRLREFTASGVIDQFAQLLKQAFDTGVTAVKNFVASIDFEQVRARIDAFTQNASERLANFGESVRGFRRSFEVVVGTIQTFVGVIGAAFNGLGTAIAGVIQFANGVAERWLALLDRMTLGTISALGRVRDEVALLGDSLAESTQTFARRTGESFDLIQRGWQKMAGTAEESARRQVAASEQTERAAEDAAAATRDHDAAVEEFRETLARAGAAAKSWDEALGQAGDTVQETTERTRELGETTDEVNDATESLGESSAEAADRLAETGEQALATGSSFDRMRQSILEATRLDELVLLGKQVDALAFSGELTTEQVLALNESLREARVALLDAGAEAENTTGAFEGLADSAAGAAQGIEDVTNAARGASEGAKNAARQFSQVLDSWRQVSPAAAAAVENFVQSQPSGSSFASFQSRLSRFTRFMEDKFGRLRDQQERSNRELNESASRASRTASSFDSASDSQDRFAGSLELSNEQAEKLNATFERMLQRLERIAELVAQLVGGKIVQEIELKVTRAPGDALTLSEQQIQTIAQRVIAAIEFDRDRT